MKTQRPHTKHRGRPKGIRLKEKERQDELWKWIKTNCQSKRLQTTMNAGDLAEPIHDALEGAGIHPPTVPNLQGSLAGQFNGDRTLHKSTIQGLALLCNVNADELRRALLEKSPFPAPTRKSVSSPQLAVEDISATVKQLLDEARELAFRGRHSDADAKCEDALASVKAHGTLPSATIRNITDLQRLGYYLRVLYYHQWRKAKPRYPVPHDVAVSEAAQAKLDQRVHIDLSVVHELLDCLGLREWRFLLPISRDQFAHIHTKDAHKRFLQAVTAAMQKALAESRAERVATLKKKIVAVTNLLCEEDPLPADAMDIAWVPGYRAHHRAEKAGEMFKAGKVRQILLSGDSPYYADDEDSPTALTEALAMAVYLIDKRPDFRLGWGNLLLESTARETLENVDRSRRVLNAVAAAKGGPVSLLIVTSPYHLRRAWLMWQQYKDAPPAIELIADLRRQKCSARVELLPDRWHLHPDGITAYMTECWKIHGGRATGEF